MASKDKIYLPRQRTRIGRAGYKGANIEVYDPATGAPSPEPPAVVKASDDDAKPVVARVGTPRAATPRRRVTSPKSGIKPLKSTGKK